MDECTSRVEEINSKLTTSNAFSRQQNLAVQAADYNDTAPPTMFMAGNDAMSGTPIPSSASSSELARESLIMEEILRIGRSHRQVIHHLDNLNNILREYIGERSRQERIDRTGRIADTECIGIPLVISLAIGALGVLLYRGMVWHQGAKARESGPKHTRKSQLCCGHDPYVLSSIPLYQRVSEK